MHAHSIFHYEHIYIYRGYHKILYIYIYTFPSFKDSTMTYLRTPAQQQRGTFSENEAQWKRLITWKVDPARWKFQFCSNENSTMRWINDLAMGQNLWYHIWVDEHPFTSYFDVHQGYRVLTHNHPSICGSMRKFMRNTPCMRKFSWIMIYEKIHEMWINLDGSMKIFSWCIGNNGIPMRLITTCMIYVD